MKRNDLKIKYIIGSYIDDPNYPTKEDLFSVADQWFHFEGGSDFIHNYRNLPLEDDTVFTNNLIKEKGLPKEAYKLLEDLINSGNLVIIKETKNTIYYKIFKR